MMRVKKKKEGERERKGNEQEEEEEENANATDNNNLTALNTNATEELSQLKIYRGYQLIDHMPIINRMCRTLQSLPLHRSDPTWLHSSSIQLMSDFAFVQQHVIRGDPVIHFNIYSHLILNFLGGEECVEVQCQSVGGMEAGAGTAVALRMMDSIHCTMVHAYQRGFKMFME